MTLFFLLKNNIFSENSAASNRWRTIVEGLQKYDINIILLFASGYSSVEERIKYGKRGSINQRTEYIYGSFQIDKGIWIKRLNVYLLQSIFNIVNIYYFKKILRQRKPDFVFVNPSLEVLRILKGVFPKSHSGFKLLMEINEYNDVFDAHATNMFQKLMNRNFNNLLMRNLLPQLDVCFVITEALRIHYSGLPCANPLTIFLKLPVTVDIGRFSSTINTKRYTKPYIAYCGSSNFKIDGLDILIRSFAEIAPDFPEIRLYIAAFWENDGPRMLNLIKEMNLTDRIIYIGTLNRDEVPEFIQNAELLVLARPDSRQAQGAFPTKLGEYLATGNPVCVTRVGEIPEYLIDKETAFLADPGSAKSFSDTMRDALSDNALAKKVGRNGMKVAIDNFGMECQAKRLYDFLQTNLPDKVNQRI